MLKDNVVLMLLLLIGLCILGGFILSAALYWGAIVLALILFYHLMVTRG